jgi:hypothetical protein
MKKEDAALKFCPLIRDRCMTDSCIAWTKTQTLDEHYRATEFIEEIYHLHNTHQKIMAIKRLREVLNITLKDAKDLSDEGNYPDKIRQFFNATDSSDDEEKGYCVRFSNTMGTNEAVKY